MRRILLALLVFTSSALAADLTGSWSGEAVTNGESHPLYFVLKQDGKTLTGSGGPEASEQHDLTSAKIEGAKVILDIAAGENATLHFELEPDGDKPDGNKLKGTFRMKRDDGDESGLVTLTKVTTGK